MARLLYITANPKPVEQSYGLSVGRALVEAYRKEKPADEIIELDLYKTHIPHIDTDVFSGWGKLQQGRAYEELSPEEKNKVGAINQLTQQFVDADIYVFVTPMWNFSFPPIVKAYIDSICIAGKTFKYTDKGPVGLLQGKRAVHIQARGGVYSEGPAKDLEFGDRYLRTVFSFIGITEVESIFVEGMSMSSLDAEKIKAEAEEKAVQLAKRLAAEKVSI